MACSILGGVIFGFTSFKSGLSQRNDLDLFPISRVPILKDFHVSKWLWRVLLGIGFFALLIIRAVNFELEFFDVFFWILSIYFISSAIYRYDRASGIKLALSTPRGEVGIIIILLIAGFLIGTYQLENIPNLIKGDEGSFFEVARYIANGEYHESIVGFGVYSFPAFSSFVQGAIMRIFGRDLWGWRFSSLLPALLSVVPLYLLGRDFFNRWVGIITSIIYISSPYYLSFARLGYNNSQAILFGIFCVWFFYQGLKKNSLFYMFLGGIASGLGFLTYTSGKLGLVIVLILFGYVFFSVFRKKAGKRFLLIALLVFVIGSALIASPHVVFGATHNPEALRNKLVESLFINLDYAVSLFGEEDIYLTSTITPIDEYQVIINSEINARLLLRGFIRSFLGLQIDEFNNNFFLSSSLVGPISVVFYVLGLYFLIAHFWKPYGFPFLVWFIAGMFFLSIISTYPPRPAHLVAIIPVLALLSGLGVYLSVEQIVQFINSKDKSWERWQPHLMLLCSLVILISGIKQYFVESPEKYRPNLEQVMNWAGLDNPPETNIYYVFGENMDQDWAPYFFRIGLAQSEFESIDIESVLDGSAVWPRSNDFAIFIEEYHTAQLLPLLKQELNSADFISIKNREEKPIGSVIIQGKVEIAKTSTFWSGLGNLLTSRTLWVVLPLTAVGLYNHYQSSPNLDLEKLKSGYSTGINRIVRSPIFRSSKREDSGIPEGEPKDDIGRKFEIGFILSWGFRKTQHDYELKFSLGHRKEPQKSQPDNEQE
jgi:4-amino-4-deoxy-L-arabinose transferase-like glycosyltransferase